MNGTTDSGVNASGSLGKALVDEHPGNLTEDTFALIVDTVRKIIDRMAVIRFFTPPMRYESRPKSIGYAYPHSVVVGDRLCVIYSVNKEDIEISRIPLSNLEAHENLDRTCDIELYQISREIGETKYLATEWQGRAADLKQKLQAWRQNVLARMPTPVPSCDPERAGAW